MAPRKDPVKAAIGRAGNYIAPVDTTGMDPSVIESLGIRRQDAQWGRVDKARKAKGLKSLPMPGSKEARS